MLGWLQVTLVAASIGILIVFLCVIIQRSCCQKKRKDLPTANQERAQNLQNGIAKVHHVSVQSLDQDHSSSNNRNNYYVFRRGLSTKPFFSWADHPSLVTDAVENGWSRFAFSPYMSSSLSVRAARSLLGACAAGDQARELEVVTSWEVCQGSADFMQKIRFNPGLKKIISSNNSMGAVSVIKTALPLPGPPLGNSSFPQEAYFEITILSPHDVDQELISKANEDRVDGDRIKLIKEDFNAKSMSENLIHVTSTYGYGNSRLDEVKHAGKEKGKIGEIIFSVGLTGGGTLPLKLPGSFPASIGFNSNGSVFLDGTKLVFESEKESWGRPEHVIGCGYNPSLKKVFFTVNSQLVHEIHCKSEAFGTPLYPTLAANAGVLVLVNLGQCIFKYPPANLQRTPNPCFIGPLANSPALGYEDSKELFSMGRIDAQWLHRSTTRSTNASNGNTIKGLDYDEESEGDLFEIVLDSSGRSPYTQQ